MPGMVEELHAIETSRNFTSSLQELQALVRHLEKALRSVERSSGSGDASDLEGYLAALGDAIAAHSTASDQCEVLAQLPSAGVPAELRQHADRVLSRAALAQDKLVASLRSALHELLSQAGWPPPIAGGAAGKASSADAGDSSGVRWQGFQAVDAEVATDIQRVLAAFIALQRSVQRTSFEAGIRDGLEEGPLLWAVEQIAAPLTDQLRLHFASGQPTDRIDKPEWLFGTALRLTRQLAPLLEPLQPSLAAHNLEHAYHLPFEFARALRVAVQAILKDHVLPRLTQHGQRDLWLHFVEETVAFEQQLAPLRGLPVAAGGDTIAPVLWNRGSCLEVICTHEEWQSAWWKAESEEGLRLLEEQLDAGNAWMPSVAYWDASMGEADPWTASPADSGPREAWRSEFWPSCCADGTVQLVEGLAQKCAWLADPTKRRDFARAVPQGVLKAFRTRLGRLASTAEDFRNIASPTWGPLVAAYICAAHHLEYSLRESSTALLLLDVEGRHGSLLESEAAAFAAFKQKWTLKLAKAVALKLTDDSIPYRRKSNLEEFLHAEADSQGRVSKRLQPALDALQMAVAMLSQHMDAVVFRDMWRAAAVAVNRLMYNDVATEARFSDEGARQFAVDCNALIAIFQPYTPRPAAHFRELKEATLLLVLPEQEAHAAANALHDAQHEAEIMSLLKQLGVTRLTREQALCVLAQRL
ncbi:hypothetical protein WJX72_000495 [[Myrmecia] bisecta]|uniref:Uncharacterized protein n=1 Tax=[Myrmecia] bisecta TaxID=41462 RepID=A0AAW1Q6I2_9CHLO